MRKLLLIALPLVALAACDGPKEKAGREQDKAAAAAAGVAYNGEGPAERAGEAQDRIDHAAKQALDAKVDAIEERARDVRRDADKSADALEAQAKELRAQARKEAEALDQQAEQAKGR